MRNCEKCRNPDTWPCETVELAGGIRAQLCTACQRAFVLRIGVSALDERCVALEARKEHYRDLALAGQPVDEEARLDLERESIAFKVELAQASVAWLGIEHGGGAGASEWPQAGSIPAPDETSLGTTDRQR